VQVDRRSGDAEALLLEVLGDVEHADVLGLADDHVVALAPVAQRVADDRQVAGLGGAAGEDDLMRVGAEERGDPAARLLSAPWRRRPHRAARRRCELLRSRKLSTGVQRLGALIVGVI
jgi:hypothetical protein